MDSITNTSFLTARFGSEWKYLDNTYFYAISKDGRLWRKHRTPHKVSGGYGDRRGYKFIRLSFGEYKGDWSMHRLMWTIWCGTIPEGMEINHIDCNKGNNNLDNLELVTRQENAAHAKANKLFRTGVWNEDKLAAYKTLKDNGWSQGRIAKAFDVTQQAVQDYLSRY